MLQKTLAIAYIPRMGNRNAIKQAQPITVAELQTIQQHLEAISGQVEAAIAYVSTGQELNTYNLASGFNGVDRLLAFANALEKAVYYSKIGKPFSAGQLKPRSIGASRKKKVTKKKPRGKP